MACSSNKCNQKIGPVCPPQRGQAFGGDVFYTGANLANGIKTNDTLNTVIQKLSAMANCIAPTIVTQPTGKTVALGEPFTLQVEFAGSNVDVQWFKGGVALAGATNPTLEISSAQASDFADYYAVGSNVCGQIQSNTVTVGQVAPEVSHYGYNADGSIPDDPTTLQHSQNFTPGEDLSSDFSDMTDVSYPIVEVPASAPVYTKWFVTSSNQGAIDSAAGGSNFLYTVVSGSSRFYLANYPTLIPSDPLVLKIS